MNYDWYDREMIALDKDLEDGVIDWEKYNKSLIDLNRELREEEQIRAACEEAYD